MIGRIFFILVFVTFSKILMAQNIEYRNLEFDKVKFDKNISAVIVLDNREGDTVIGTLKVGAFNNRKQLALTGGLQKNVWQLMSQMIDSSANKGDTLLLNIRKFRAYENLNPNKEQAYFDVHITYYIIKNNKGYLLTELDTLYKFKSALDITNKLIYKISSVLCKTAFNAASVDEKIFLSNPANIHDIIHVKEIELQSAPLINGKKIPVGIYKNYTGLKNGTPIIKKYKFEDDFFYDLSFVNPKEYNGAVFAINNGKHIYLLINNDWAKLHQTGDSMFVYARVINVANNSDYFVMQALFGVVGLAILESSLNGYGKFYLSKLNGDLYFIDPITKKEWLDKNKPND